MLGAAVNAIAALDPGAVFLGVTVAGWYSLYCFKHWVT